ncbi:MAG: arylesterase [Desulfobacterales bacterium]|jgi:acyl-CoA thioesterase-1|nr:arylesterase [Desulfobacterales bacterium]
MDTAPLHIVALGDSLTEGFGVAPGDAYPYVLQQMLEDDGIACRLINFGVSGDTCRGVLARLDTIPSWSPDLVILEIGVNDILMGRWPERIQADLGAIVQRLVGWRIPVALAGMQMPPLGDPETETAFAAIYPAVAQAFRIPLIADFTAPLWAVPNRVQYDGLHPNAEGYRAICAHIRPTVMRIIRALPSFSKMAPGNKKDFGTT